MGPLWHKLLLVVELLLSMLGLSLLGRLRLRLLPRLQNSLLLLQTVCLAKDSRIVRGRLHWQGRTSRCILGHTGLRHHFHRHGIWRHRAIHRPTTGHSLQMGSSWIHSDTRRYSIW